MNRISLIRKVALTGALISALSIAGATFAATPNSHASSTAVDVSAGVDAVAVSAAAASDITGGAHNNHGGYVSCVARGGTDCTTTTPTLPAHGQAATHDVGSAHSQAGTHPHTH